ncbi:MAG: hypothetical protein ACRDRU_15815, partial [Pseudonocardiaceae bacterium]
MPKRKPGPTLRAQWLGQQLRALRETAEYPIRRGDVLALLDLYSVSAARTRDGLLQLSDDVWRKGW